MYMQHTIGALSTWPASQVILPSVSAEHVAFMDSSKKLALLARLVPKRRTKMERVFISMAVVLKIEVLRRVLYSVWQIMLSPELKASKFELAIYISSGRNVIDPSYKS